MAHTALTLSVCRSINLATLRCDLATLHSTALCCELAILRCTVLRRAAMWRAVVCRGRALWIRRWQYHCHRVNSRQSHLHPHSSHPVNLRSKWPKQTTTVINDWYTKTFEILQSIKQLDVTDFKKNYSITYGFSFTYVVLFEHLQGIRIRLYMKVVMSRWRSLQKKVENSFSRNLHLRVSKKISSQCP